MSNDEALFPDPAEIVRNTIKTLDSSTPNMNNDELWASIAKYVGYRKALRPYIEDRIAKLQSMSEINFNGKEKAEEVGIRYLICSAVAHELQDIITKIEVTGQVIDQLKKDKNGQS